MKRWERLELWLFDNSVDSFSAGRLGKALGMSTQEASAHISAYQVAQRGKRAATLYVLKRRGRTSGAVWSVGERTLDARAIGQTLFEDVHVKVKKAFQPDLERLAKRNPRAARYCEQKIDAVVNGALVVLASAVDVLLEDDE